MKEETACSVSVCIQGDESDRSGYGHQDDHIKVQSHMTGAAPGDGSWTEGVTTRTKTTTRTYTDSDGTLITEVRLLSIDRVPCCSKSARVQITRTMMSVFVCLSIRSHISKITWPNFTKFSMHVDCGRGSFILWQHCDMLCTSGSIDDVMLSHSGPMARHAYS